MVWENEEAACFRNTLSLKSLVEPSIVVFHIKVQVLVTKFSIACECIRVLVNSMLKLEVLASL